MNGARRVLALSMVVAATAIVGMVSAADWRSSWDSVRSAARNVETIKADFVQTRTVRILKHPIVSRGRFAYRRQGDLRWEYTSPIKSVMVLRGGSVERYIGRGDGFVRDSSAKLDAVASVVQEINLWLGGDFTKSKTFRPSLARAGGKAKVDLVPVDPTMRAIISRIELVFGEAPGTVESIVIDEGSEGKTQIDFDGVRINEGVTDADFAPAQ
jgi:outer membrane lipoprotein-sorting protein